MIKRLRGIVAVWHWVQLLAALLGHTFVAGALVVLAAGFTDWLYPPPVTDHLIFWLAAVVFTAAWLIAVLGTLWFWFDARATS